MFAFGAHLREIKAERTQPAATEKRDQQPRCKKKKKHSDCLQVQMLPDKAHLGKLRRAGMWQGRWNCLEHLSQDSSFPPVWQTAHNPPSERFNRASCSTSPPTHRLRSAPSLLLWSLGVFWRCTGLWNPSILWREETSSSSWLITRVSWPGWSPVLSGKLVLLLTWDRDPGQEQPLSELATKLLSQKKQTLSFTWK